MQYYRKRKLIKYLRTVLIACAWCDKLGTTDLCSECESKNQLYKASFENWLGFDLTPYWRVRNE